MSAHIIPFLRKSHFYLKCMNSFPDFLLKIRCIKPTNKPAVTSFMLALSQYNEFVVKRLPQYNQKHRFQIFHAIYVPSAYTNTNLRTYVFCRHMIFPHCFSSLFSSLFSRLSFSTNFYAIGSLLLPIRSKKSALL